MAPRPPRSTAAASSAVALLLGLLASSADLNAASPPPCRSNEGEPGRFPTWPATWVLQDSTIVQPCNTSGYLDDAYAQFGVVSVDWSNAKQLWVVPPMSTEQMHVEQAARLKAVRPGVRVFGYRNIVKALPWFSAVRAAMDDPAYSGFFLRFAPNQTYHVPQCDKNYDPPKCTPFYHDEEQTPGYPSGDGNCPAPACDCGVHPCGEYLFDHRNGTMLQDWIVNELLGPSLVGNSNISGAYLDDEWYNTTMYWGCSATPVGGATEEDGSCLADMGLQTQAFTTEMTDAWCATRHRAMEAARLSGGWFWQMFSLFSTPAQAQCAAVLRPLCAAGASSAVYNATTMHSLSGDHATLPNLMQDLAAFLLLRGPYAYLGFGWSGCNVVTAFPAVLKTDLGAPQGFCSETAPGSGVFTRDWEKATVALDCNTYVGTVSPKAEAR